MIELNPIAVVKNSRKTVEDDQWGEVFSTIELLDPLQEEALAGIESFSHVEIIFYFDQVNPEKKRARRQASAQQPRMAPGWHPRPTRKEPSQSDRRHHMQIEKPHGQNPHSTGP